MANLSPYDYNLGDFADYQMPETEEERQRRLAAEAAARTPVKQTITTDPVTGEQNMTISGNVRDLGPENTLTPTVYGAGEAATRGFQAVQPAEVDTGAVYNRMIQAESGGRQYDRNGQILTSPKGALGMAQVMPATALNPGYGVRPATMEEISTPEGNRAFGQRYFQGLLNYFGGDVQKATAAYNGGPGRVSRNVSANGGQLNVAQLPAETQQYLRAVGPIAPAQAAAPIQTETIMSSAPAANAGVRPGAVLGQGGTATQEGTAGEIPAQQAMAEANNRFVAAQAQPEAMVSLAQDSAAQPWLRALARDQVVENLTQAREKEKATREVEAARQDPNALARMLQAKSSEQGSYAKAMLFSILGMEKSAADEAAKLGIGSKWSTMTDVNGKTALIKVRSDGVPLEGYDSSTGRQLNSNDLVAVLGAGQRKLDIVGGTYVNDTTGEVGRAISDKTTGITYIQTDTGRKGMTGFRPQGNAGTLEMQRQAQIQKQNIDLAGDYAKTQMRIQGAAPEAYNKFIGEFNAKWGTNFTIKDFAGGPPQIDLTTNRVVSSAPAAVAPAASATPAAASTVSGAVAPEATGVSGAAPAAVAAGPVVPVVSGGGATTVSTAGKTPAQILKAEEDAKRAADEARAAREAENKKRLAIEEAQGKQPVEVGTAEQKDFVTYKTTVQDKAESGRDVARVTRSQVKDLMQDPVIIGIMNGSGTQYAAAGKLIREMAAGAYSDDDNGKRLADDIRGLSLTQPQKDALSRYAQANTSINRATLKANSGAGSISNAEQTANKAANMTNIGDLTPFAALTGLSRRSYMGDLTQEKAAMLAASKYVTRDQFDQAWQKIEDQRVKQYDGIYRARLDLIKPFAEKATANPNDAQAQQRYRDAAIHAFRVYPTPEYTAGVGWTFPTKESKQAAMAAIAGDR